LEAFHGSGSAIQRECLTNLSVLSQCVPEIVHHAETRDSRWPMQQGNAVVYVHVEAERWWCWRCLRHNTAILVYLELGLSDKAAPQRRKWIRVKVMDCLCPPIERSNRGKLCGDRLIAMPFLSRCISRDEVLS